MGKVLVMEHPLIQHKIGIIRRKETSSKEFRELVSEVAMFMAYEATRDPDHGACRKGRPYWFIP